MPKLNQIIAIEKPLKTRVNAEVTEAHRTSTKTEQFNGFKKSYRKLSEDDADLPGEGKKVQANAEQSIKDLGSRLAELFDVTATKDWANCHAKADIVVDDTTLATQVPVTYLLFLEKQLNDIRTFVNNLPTLDDQEDWTHDPNSGLYKTGVISTHRLKKIQRPLVLYPHSPEHPAQTQLVTEDVIAGYWDTVKFSGALPAPRKASLLERVEKLSQAVKFAREQANGVEAVPQNVAGQLLAYVLE